MTGPVFVDTNVIVYRHDSSDTANNLEPTCESLLQTVTNSFMIERSARPSTVLNASVRPTRCRSGANSWSSTHSPDIEILDKRRPSDDIDDPHA